MAESDSTTATAMPSNAAKHRVLREVFGFSDFRPGQERVIDALLAGRHTLAVMPTGAGKSLCFQIPALVRGGLTVVVSPLVALMQNQVNALRLSGVAAAAINSSRSRPENVQTWRHVQSGGVTLLYMAPERLMTEPMLAALARQRISYFVIDEAHCISQWGHSFRPEYEALKRLRELFPAVPIAAFTATADRFTREDIVEKLFGESAAVFVSGFDRPNISLAVAPKKSWRRQLDAFLASRRGQSGIVYCLSRAKTEETAEHLRADGYKALAYHAGMDSVTRAQHQDTFLTEPGVVMVATIAFGMGIDKPDVRFVFHTDLPASVEAYYQEVGRAGRDGDPADACMLYGMEDIRRRRMFIDDSAAPEERKRLDHRRLDALLAYCEAPECRRQMLLAYFGEATTACGNCDVCLDPAVPIDATVDGQKALSTVYRTGQRFGAAHIIDSLVGSQTEKIGKFRHDRLSTFGVGSDRKPAEWRSIIRQLVAAGFLHLDIGGHGSLKLTERGRALLHGSETFRIRLDTASVAKKRRRDKRAAAESADDAARPDGVLLQRLKELRLELARERGVPAFVIFHDSTLVELSRRRPRDRLQFAQIPGVGAAKLHDLADRFLDVIARFDDRERA